MVCLSAAWGQQYTIKTIAGNGTLGNVGDSGDAAASQLNSPGAVVLGPNGNLYIADTGNHCIRMISGTSISTIAGKCGTIGQSGEGGAATAALLNAPSGLAFDSAGNLYIADTGNSVIRKITGTTISRIAGQYNQAGYGGDNGAATSANLNGATAVALDSAGNLYIADTETNLIRKVDAKTQIITSFLGAGATDKRLDHPNGLWFDAASALYIADSNHQAVSKYVAPTLSLFAGNQTAAFSGDGGPALRAQLNKPVGVMGDAAGNIYIADTNNSRIRKVTADGNITTIAGKGGSSYSGDGGSATDAFLSFPRSVAVSSNGTIYIADTGNHSIRALTPTFPAISDKGVVNAASFVNRISPGALATIFGTGLASSTFQADDGFNWPTTAKSVTVRVNGVNAPLYYVSPGQINFQVPWTTPTSGTVNLSVLFNGGASNTVAVPVATAAPGLFFNPTGGAAIVQNTPDYSLNDPSNPAAKGSTIIAYLTGSGPLSVAQKDGTPASLTTLVSATSAVTARIGSLPASVSFAGLTPGYIGLLQMNIVVPTSLGAGVYTLEITIDGQTANTATIAVK